MVNIILAKHCVSIVITYSLTEPLALAVELQTPKFFSYSLYLCICYVQRVLCFISITAARDSEAKEILCQEIGCGFLFYISYNMSNS